MFASSIQFFMVLKVFLQIITLPRLLKKMDSIYGLLCVVIEKSSGFFIYVMPFLLNCFLIKYKTHITAMKMIAEIISVLLRLLSNQKMAAMPTIGIINPPGILNVFPASFCFVLLN